MKPAPIKSKIPRTHQAVGARSTPPEGDVAGTHNGLRSHGCFRCLVIRLRRTSRSSLQQISAGGAFEIGLHPAPGLRASKRRIRVNVPVGVPRRVHAGNDETPRGSPHGVLR